MRRHISAESIGAAVAIALCVAQAGCSPACDTTDDGNPAERYEGGAVIGGDEPYYVSSDWDHGLLPYPGGKRYDLVHHLGFVPVDVAVYVSFADRDKPLTPCSGNTCILQAVTSERITLKNDTCSDFWVRIVASGGSPTDAGATADTGTD